MKGIKHYIIICITIILMTTLTSCKIDDITIKDVKNELNNRVNQDSAIVDELVQMSIIDSATGDNIKKNMNSVINEFNTNISDADSMSQLFAYISAWRDVTSYEYATVHGYTCTTDPKTGAVTHWSSKIPDDWDKTYLTSFARKNLGDAELDGQLVTDDRAAGGNGTHSFELISSKFAENINNMLSYNVCVLNKNAKDINGNPITLETIASLAKDLDTTDSNSMMEFKNKYFIETKAPVIDITKPEYQLIQDTKGSYNRMISDGLGYMTAGCTNHGGKVLANLVEDPAKPGYDINVKQDGKLTLKIRLKDFNEEAFDNIKAILGKSNDKYLFMGDNSGGFALLMEYPVGYINNIEIDDDNNYKLNIEKSRITVNIRTGKINKLDSDGNIINANNNDAYYVLSNGAETSSFGLYGETGIDGDGTENPWNLEFGPEGKEVKVSIPRIILKDYLEATYGPGIVEEENLVVYGRKIRIDIDRINLGTKLSNSNRIPIGWYCEQGGTKPDTESEARWVYLDQLCDYDALNRGYSSNNNSKPYIKRLPNTINTGYSNEDTVNMADGLTGDKPEAIENLSEVIVKQIYPTCIFPGRHGLVNSTLQTSDTHGIGMTDIAALTDTNNDLPVMYCIAISTPIVESGLLNWLTSESTEESIVWWKSWLESHQYTYADKLRLDMLNEYLSDNYSFSLAEDGLVLLNLDTIARINEEFEHKDNLDRTRWVRTISKILGFMLILYGLLLLICWTFDVNVDLGFNLLEKVSFNQMIAVSSRVEIPQTSDSGQRYVQFSDIVSRSLGIVFLGFILMKLDAVMIAKILIETLGGITRLIERLRG